MKQKVTQRRPEKRPIPKDFMTPREVADRSGIGLIGVYRLLKSGQLPTVRIGKRFYVPVASYESYLANWEGSTNPPLSAA
jgi:excisionase family DNA binding protein